MPPISLHVTLQKVSGDKNGRSNNKFKLLRSVSLDEFVLPKIQQRVRKRVNSERKPYSVHPFPKLGSGKMDIFVRYQISHHSFSFGSSRMKRIYKFVFFKLKL